MSEEPTQAGSRRSHRREFLTGQAAGQVAADAVVRAAGYLGEFADALGPPPPAPAPASKPAYVVSLKRRAMACDFEVMLNADRADDRTPSSAGLAALDLVDELESQMTVYRAESEVQTINRMAADDWVGVESQLFGVLELAGQLHRDTDGAFDITGGPLSRVWGFDRRQGQLPTEEQIAEALRRVGWQHVELDSERQAIRFEQPAVEINLNSIGKGYALDRAAQLLVEQEVDNFLLHGGRSTLVARGRRTGQRGWTVRVRHPLRPQELIAELELADAALSTSGSATQSFVLGGKRYGHLIDPRTGWPADQMHSATVIAPSGALADALSTAFYVMGEQAVEAYCQQHPAIGALLVLPGERTGEVRAAAFNLSKP